MSRWPRVVFVGYVFLVLVGIVHSVWPFSSNLFQQWSVGSVESFEFGPIQSGDGLKADVLPVIAADPNGPNLSGPRRATIESEIDFKFSSFDGRGFSLRSLTASDGRFYFASGAWFYAVESDGRLRWSFRPGGAALAANQVLIAKERVLISSDNGGIYCFDMAGRMQWMKRTKRMNLIGAAKSKVHVVLTESKAVASVASGAGTRLEALSVLDGRLSWRSEFLLPALLRGLLHSETKIVAYGAKSYSIIDAEVGNLLSVHNLVDEIASASYSAKFDLLITKSIDGKYRAFEASSGKVIWTKIPSETTSDWISAIVNSGTRVGFWAIGARNRAIFRELRTGRELAVIQLKHALTERATLDTDSMLIALADRPGLVRIR